MTILDIDFTGVEAGGGFLPEGTYRASVVAVDVRPGKKDDYLHWTFESREPDTAGLRSTLMTSLSESALWKLKETLIGLGLHVDGPVRFDTAKLIGQQGRIVVVNEPYTGSDGVQRDSHKVARLLPSESATAPGDPSAEPPRAVHNDVAAHPGWPRTTTTADPTAAPIGEDDIPF